ncbi:MAG: hypothetical protein ACM3NO_04595 [Deltaproteobacteria bacterium]
MNRILRWLICCLALAIAASARAADNPGDLKFLISIEQPVVTAPLAARITLQLHNSGKEPMWIYTPARDVTLVSGAVNPFTAEDLGEGATAGGSSLEMRLVPADGSSPEIPANGRVLEVAEFPHPKLIALAPGGDYEEAAFVQFAPGTTTQGDVDVPHWGAYRLTAVYRAKYSNGASLKQLLDARFWEGEVESNEIRVELRPPAADARASIEGTVMNSELQPVFGFVVTLSDQDSRPLAQTTSDGDGKCKFDHLPFGFYWLTARRGVANEEAVVLRHATTSSSEPEASVELVLVPREITRPAQLLHKPVLFKILDAQDKPLEGISLDDTWVARTVSDRARGETGSDGTVVLSLLPGPNFLTLRRKGCPKQEERMEVSPGIGIDGFKFNIECGRN